MEASKEGKETEEKEEERNGEKAELKNVDL